MFNIQKYLEKFSKNIQSSEIYKNQILDIINDNTGLKLSGADIEIKNYIVYIKSGVAVKNKIFISKNKILEYIEKLMPIKIVDIK
ncbi:MAG: hypothetical protein WAX85_01890 [Minisyncoccia bacterium]